MAQQGWRNKNNILFGYIENDSPVSFSFGIDAGDGDKLKLSAVDAAGIIPSTNPQIVIDPAANGDITFDPLGTGHTDIQANVQATSISFDSGTNILGDIVERASWTPVLTFGGASTGITYATQSGYYMRVGNVVTVQCNIVLTNAGTASGTADKYITGYTGPIPTNTVTLETNIEFISYGFGGIAGQIESSTGNLVIGVERNGDIFEPLHRSDGAFSSFANNAHLMLTGAFII